MQNQEQINEFIDLLIAGFVGDSQLITNTICVLRAVLEKFTGSLSIDSLKFMLDQVLTFLIGKTRMEVDAALHFLHSYTKILPVPLVTNYLSLIVSIALSSSSALRQCVNSKLLFSIPNSFVYPFLLRKVKSLSMMVPDTKRHCRLILGYIWKKLCKRFGAQEVIQLVPGNDEETHKRLKKIRKDLSRAKRNKQGRDGKDGEEKDEEDDEDDFTSELQKKSLT